MAAKFLFVFLFKVQGMKELGVNIARSNFYML